MTTTLQYSTFVLKGPCLCALTVPYPLRRETTIFIDCNNIDCFMQVGRQLADGDDYESKELVHVSNSYISHLFRAAISSAETASRTCNLICQVSKIRSSLISDIPIPCTQETIQSMISNGPRLGRWDRLRSPIGKSGGVGLPSPSDRVTESVSRKPRLPAFLINLKFVSFF